MPVTREQLQAAGVGASSLDLWERQARRSRALADAMSGGAGDDVVRRLRTGTGDGRGTVFPLVFSLDGRVASAKNHTRPTVRDGKVTGVRKSKAAEAWAKAAVPQLEAQRPRYHEPIEAPVRVELVLYGPVTHPHSVDGDNALGGVLDALVAAKILADDKPRIVRKSSAEWVPAPSWSAEIRIAPYEGPAA